jgi:hypothetical protein
MDFKFIGLSNMDGGPRGRKILKMVNEYFPFHELLTLVRFYSGKH